MAADLGCNRGFVSKHIMADTVGHLHLCDISPSMLTQAAGTPGLTITRHEMDEERLQFEPDSLDLVVSSLSMHWVNDLPGCFAQIKRSLRPDGVFIGALYGGETLFELRSALQLAEVERRGGLAPHVSPFTQIRDIGGLLNRAGFTMLTIDTDEMVVGYPSMFELMWDLKGMAESNAAFNRPLHLSRDTMLAAASIYRDLYAQGDGIAATFQIIYFVGWKPSAGQAQPLAPGSGTVSLKDLGAVIENDGKTTTTATKTCSK